MEIAVKSKIVKNGDLVVITAGVPVGVSGTTNILKVHVVGHVLVEGRGWGSGKVTARVCVAKILMSSSKILKMEILLSQRRQPMSLFLI